MAPPAALHYTRTDFEAVRVPTLVTYGENDSMGVKGAALLGAIPGSQAYMVKGGSHPCYRDDPAGWNGAVVAFVNSLKG